MDHNFIVNAAFQLLNKDVQSQCLASFEIPVRLFTLLLITSATSASLLAQSFQPQVKGLDSKTINPEVKSLSGASTAPTTQGLNQTIQPSVQGLAASQSGQQGGSQIGSPSSADTQSAAGPASGGAASGGPALGGAASTGSPSTKTATSSGRSTEKFFTCSRCGIEGAQAQGYCLGNFGMLLDSKQMPLKHIR